jgi:prolyl-tRNA synthetase
MLRAGMIRRLAAGLYTWLPLGAARAAQGRGRGARGNEPRRRHRALLMPAVQPAELWQESGRWDYGPELLRIKDRHERDFCFGPPTRRSSPTSRAAS